MYVCIRIYIYIYICTWDNPLCNWTYEAWDDPQIRQTQMMRKLCVEFLSWDDEIPN